MTRRSRSRHVLFYNYPREKIGVVCDNPLNKPTSNNNNNAFIWQGKGARKRKNGGVEGWKVEKLGSPSVLHTLPFSRMLKGFRINGEVRRMNIFQVLTAYRRNECFQYSLSRLSKRARVRISRGPGRWLCFTLWSRRPPTWPLLGNSRLRKFSESSGEQTEEGEAFTARLHETPD